MDIIDTSNDMVDLITSVAIKNRHPPAPFTGFCLNCDEHIDRGQFCNADCRHDHEMRVRAQRQSVRGRYEHNKVNSPSNQ